MRGLSNIAPDLISVIIPSYNHGKYVSEAIESVYAQRNVDVEIIVVDDGSTDDTKKVIQKYPDVHYIYQTNQGLSAARNTGIDNSSGKYFVFLDADDWLLEDALSANLKYLKENESLAFVSGAHQYISEMIGKTMDIVREVPGDYYRQLLVWNYIGMHAAVMYRHWVFDHFRFDTSLKASEDYDIYLKVARKFPVLHHTRLIAAYRIHGTNMSGNIPMMLTYTLKVLQRQEPVLQNQAEKNDLRRGIHSWKEWYCKELYKKLKPLPVFTNKNSASEMKMMWQYKKTLLLRYLVIYQFKLLKWGIKKVTPVSISRQLYKVTGRYKNFIPQENR